MPTFTRHLQTEKDYNDLFDSWTIKECESKVLSLAKQEGLPTPDLNTITKKDFTPLMKMVLYFYAGHQWKRKQEFIKESVQRDRNRNTALEEIERTYPPDSSFRCEDCRDTNHNHKDTIIVPESINKDAETLLYMFTCNICDKRHAFYANGKRYISTPKTCETCRIPLDTSTKKTKTKHTFIDTCSSCGFTDSWDIDLKTESIAEKKRKRKLFERKQALYCLTDKEGGKFVGAMFRMKQLQELFKEHDQKQTDAVWYEKAKSIKKLSILALQKRLEKSLKKKQFERIHFEQPETSRHVTCGFQVYEANEDRSKEESLAVLSDTIDKTLKDTNWVPQKSSLSYRLGMIYAKVKALETEDDIVKHLKKSS